MLGNTSFKPCVFITGKNKQKIRVFCHAFTKYIRLDCLLQMLSVRIFGILYMYKIEPPVCLQAYSRNSSVYKEMYEYKMSEP